MAFIRIQKRGKKKYLYLVSNKWVNGTCKQKVLKYLGTFDNLAEQLSEIHSLKKSEFITYNYGEIKVLYELCKELNLIEILNKFTIKGGGIDAGKLALIIILNHCTEQRSKSKIERWLSKTYLPQLLNIDSKKANKNSLTTLLDYLTEERIQKIETALVKQLEKLFKIKKECLMYDITSTYVYGNNCDLAKYGYNRDKVPHKQINFGLVVSKKEKFPLMHKIFPGNTVDVSTVKQTSSELKERLKLSDNSCMLVMDRGMISVDNLEHLDKLKFGYIVGLSKSNNDTKDLIMEANNFIEVDKKEEISACEKVLLHKNKQKKFVVFFNKKIKRKEQLKRKNRIEQVKIKLENLCNNSQQGKYKDKTKLIMKIGEITKGTRKYFNFNFDKKLSKFQFSVNQSALENDEKYDGKSVVCSTDTSMSPLDIWNAYNDKDKVEKAFRCIKTFVKIRPIRHWKPNRVKAHIFLCILAHLIQKILEHKLQKLKMSAQECIDLLSDIKLISYNFETENINKITKIEEKQKLILKKLNIDFI